MYNKRMMTVVQGQGCQFQEWRVTISDCCLERTNLKIFTGHFQQATKKMRSGELYNTILAWK